MNGEDVLIQEQERNVLSDFFGAAQEKLRQFTDRHTNAPESPQSAIGGSLFEAIYQFGAGKASAGIEKLITGSSAGRKAIANIEQQRVTAWLPWIIAGVAVLLILGFAFGRR